MVFLDQWKLAIFVDETETPDATDFRRRVELAVVKVATQVLGESRSGTPISLTNITQANPAQVTSNSHGLINGQLVRLDAVGGMVEVNGVFYHITNVTTNTFDLDTDSSSFAAYTSGGTVTHFFSAARYQKRAVFASSILSILSDLVSGFQAGSTTLLDTVSLAVTSNAAISASSLDSDIEFQLNAVWDDLAGVFGIDLEGF